MDDPIEADWGDEEPIAEDKDTTEVPADTEEVYDDIHSQTACPHCDTQLNVGIVLCHICGGLQEIGNSFTQAQRQEIRRENICFLEDKLHIRIFSKCQQLTNAKAPTLDMTKTETRRGARKVSSGPGRPEGKAMPP